MSTTRLTTKTLKIRKHLTYTPEKWAVHRTSYWKFYFQWQSKIPYMKDNIFQSFLIRNPKVPGTEFSNLHIGTGKPASAMERAIARVKGGIFERPWVAILWLTTIPCCVFFCVVGEDPNNDTNPLHDPLYHPEYRYSPLKFRPGYTYAMIREDVVNQDHLFAGAKAKPSKSRSAQGVRASS